MKPFLFFAILIILSCNSFMDKDNIMKKSWKYDSGFSVGDFLEFNNETDLKVDKDYFLVEDGVKVAKIKSANQHNLIICNLDDASLEGIYVNK